MPNLIRWGDPHHPTHRPGMPPPPSSALATEIGTRHRDRQAHMPSSAVAAELTGGWGCGVRGWGWGSGVGRGWGGGEAQRGGGGQDEAAAALLAAVAATIVAMTAALIASIALRTASDAKLPCEIAFARTLSSRRARPVPGNTTWTLSTA